MPGKFKVFIDIGFDLLKQLLQVAITSKVAGKVNYITGKRIIGRDVDEARGAVLTGGGYSAVALDDETTGTVLADDKLADGGAADEAGDRRLRQLFGVRFIPV